MDFAVGFAFGVAAGWLTAALAWSILGLVRRSALGGTGRPRREREAALARHLRSDKPTL
jgi:hypothetical protein